MRGEEVRVLTASSWHEDELGCPHPSDPEWATVGNVLVAQGDPAATGGDNRPDGAYVSFTLYMPADWDGDVSGGLVEVRGRKCRVVGEPTSWPDSPTDWRWVVRAEATDG